MTASYYKKNNLKIYYKQILLFSIDELLFFFKKGENMIIKQGKMIVSILLLFSIFMILNSSYGADITVSSANAVDSDIHLNSLDIKTNSPNTFKSQIESEATNSFSQLNSNVLEFSDSNIILNKINPFNIIFSLKNFSFSKDTINDVHHRNIDSSVSALHITKSNLVLAKGTDHIVQVPKPIHHNDGLKIFKVKRFSHRHNVIYKTIGKNNFLKSKLKINSIGGKFVKYNNGKTIVGCESISSGAETFKLSKAIMFNKQFQISYDKNDNEENNKLIKRKN